MTRLRSDVPGRQELPRPGRRVDETKTERRRRLGLEPTWARPDDEETVGLVCLMARAAAIMHGLGFTDEACARMVSRPGREIGVWTWRSWREGHRANGMQAGDLIALVRRGPEEVCRAVVGWMAAQGGMVAVDQPEGELAPKTLELAGLEVGVECGQLQAALLDAAMDGRVTPEELERIAAEARDVQREAARLALACGGGG